MESAKQARAISWVIALLILGLFLGVRATHPDLDRPFEWDELTTLRYFTWAGVESTGEPRSLDRIEEIRGLGRPGSREFAIGLYCSLGRWPEPGNHVVHSLLANFTMGLLRPSEASLRWSALAGTVVFGLVLFWFVAVTLQWRWAAPAALILALWNPFVWRYSVTARGYTWLFALQILLLILLLRLPRRSAWIVGTAAAVFVATLSFMNHLTMAVYWIFPVYVTFWVLAPNERGRSGELTTRERIVWRRNLMIQVLIIAALAGMFVVDRLPYIYASAGGARLELGGDSQSLSGVAEGLGSTLSRLSSIADRVGSKLFPGAIWKLVAICGLLGLLLAPRRSARRTILAVALVGGAVALTHFFVSGRIPPPRVLSWVIPVALIGVAGLVEGLLRRLPTGRVRISAALAFAVVCVLLVVAGFQGLPTTTPIEDLVAAFDEKASADVPSTTVLLDRRVGPVVPLYLPRSWQGVEKPPDEGPTRLLMIVRRTNWYGLRLATRDQDHVADPWEPLAWPGVGDLEIGTDYRMLESSGRIAGFPVDGEFSRALVFWYPAIESVAVRPLAVLQHLEDFSLRYLAIKVPFAAELEVFFRLGCLVFPADSSAELAEIDRAVRAGLDRFGGVARVFVPDTPEP